MRELVSRTQCSCGQALWKENRWNGYYLSPVYFPDGEKPAFGKELQVCPQCGRRLSPDRPHSAFHSLGAPA
jgi:uncharacterized protein with PIN domain